MTATFRLYQLLRIHYYAGRHDELLNVSGNLVRSSSEGVPAALQPSIQTRATRIFGGLWISYEFLN